MTSAIYDFAILVVSIFNIVKRKRGKRVGFK